MANAIYLGTAIQLVANFYTGADSKPTDPTTVALAFRNGPNGAITRWTFGGTGSIDQLGVGYFVATLVPNAAGVFTYQWTGTGACAVVQTGTFEVSTPPL